MKFVILACSFVVLLACNGAQCDRGRPVITGNCRVTDLPVEQRTSCAEIRCDRNRYGAVHWSATLCPTYHRCYDTPGKWTVPDITKFYPGCCPELECQSSWN